MNERTVPEVRFRGFRGEWEEKILCYLSPTTYGGGTPNTAINEFWSGNIPWIQSSDLVEHDVGSVLVRRRISNLAISKSATKIIPKASIAVVTRVGVGKLAVIPFQYATSQDFLSLSNLTADKWFTVYSLYRKLQNELNQVQGTSIKGITKDELLKKALFVSENTDEQTKIGGFFKNLDDLIAQNQKKYDKLVNMKKACLDKMFPKDGADTPEVRFKGFSDGWERNDLSQVADYKNGKSHESKQCEKGKYELINLNSISIDGGLKCSNKYIYDADETLIKNDLVMILSDVGHGDLLGRVALIPESNKYVLNQRVALLRPKSIIDPRFLFSCINSSQKYFKLQGAGMSQLNISKGTVETFLLNKPEKTEQTAIGTFFKTLDNLITLRKTELEKLKNIKKACLDKMFI